MNLATIAVDDEPLALGLLTTYIDKTPFLELSGAYTNALEALQAIQQNTVDLVFLDIQMSDLTGIELARLLEKQQPRHTRIIFTTAFNQFALEGYKVDALDYLLKPFNYEEFLRAAQKGLVYFELLNNKSTGAAADSPKENYLFLKVEYQLVRFAYKDILFIEGLKDYVKVHLASTPRPVLSLTSLKALEDKLPSEKFMRIHRSFIINLDNVSAVTKTSVQIGNETIPVSDQYKDAFATFLNKWL